MPRIEPLIATGYAVGLEQLEGLNFRANKPYRACLICGEVFQTEDDRRFGDTPQTAFVRAAWAVSHAKTHSEKEHMMLALSGSAYTPEAAQKLAAFGLISLTDLVMSPEHEDALANAKSIPINDAEGR